MTQIPSSAIPASATPAGALPERRACLVALGGSRFAVDVRSAREVVLFDEITVVPRAPRHLVGVANLRGTVMPIVDVRALLELPEAGPARSARTLVVRDGVLQAAVVVDMVLGLEPLEEVLPVDSPKALGLRGPRPLIAGWIRWASETLALLDVPKILASLRASTSPVAREVSA
jgi:purine-binding chemotaxis protein CheW